MTWCKTQNYSSNNPYLVRKGKFQKEFLSIQGVEVKKLYDGARVFGPEESDIVMSEASDDTLKGPMSSFFTNFSPQEITGI